PCCLPSSVSHLAPPLTPRPATSPARRDHLGHLQPGHHLCAPHCPCQGRRHLRRPVHFFRPDARIRHRPLRCNTASLLRTAILQRPWHNGHQVEQRPAKHALGQRRGCHPRRPDSRYV